MKNAKLIALNDNAAVFVRFSEKMINDYVDCYKKASVPGGYGKECDNCSIDSKYGCLIVEFPELDEEFKRRVKNGL